MMMSERYPLAALESVPADIREAMLKVQEKTKPHPRHNPAMQQPTALARSIASKPQQQQPALPSSEATRAPPPVPK
ncbi:MAG: hypothetical protein EBV89_11205, partial [Betaproteobacteria bacterium]|nr:hypothetical protein [Betaproteobacteria bacterium]